MPYLTYTLPPTLYTPITFDLTQKRNPLKCAAGIRGKMGEDLKWKQNMLKYFIDLLISRSPNDVKFTPSIVPLLLYKTTYVIYISVSKSLSATVCRHQCVLSYIELHCGYSKISHFSWEILTNVLYYKYAIHSSGRKKMLSPNGFNMTSFIHSIVIQQIRINHVTWTLSNQRQHKPCLHLFDWYGFLFFTLLWSQKCRQKGFNRTCKNRSFVQGKHNRVPRAEKGKGDNSNMNNW